MRRLIPLFFMILVPALSALLIIQQTDKTAHSEASLPKSISARTNHADHSTFEVLNTDFKTGPDVTAACLSCHTSRGEEVMATAHWNWSREEEIPGKGLIELGKRNALSNYCLGIKGSEQACAQCHIGYGYKDENFDFTDEKNIDCLVCHDNTQKYKKKKDGAGYPDESVDLGYVARNVSYPTRENCGVCHFYGGVGNNGKHGDLDAIMVDCSRKIDVHMGSDGRDMNCTECHKTVDHQIMGKLYTVSSENIDRVSCEQCHTSMPHDKQILNEHYLRIACQTCHIPHYARANGTSLTQDWSTVGSTDEKGRPMEWKDQDGNNKYLSSKGTFVWDDEIVPEYLWFNGTASHHLWEDKIDTSQLPLKLNTLLGEYCIKADTMGEQKCAKIFPVKIHRAKQLYDPVNLTLIQPKLPGDKEGENADSKEFDWDKSIQAGMETMGMDYSGKYDFIETEMYWPLNHQVARKRDALSCKSCHVRSGGRIEGLSDFYLPGRDRMGMLDSAGVILILISILGVIVHFILRIIYQKDCFLL